IYRHRHTHCANIFQPLPTRSNLSAELSKHTLGAYSQTDLDAIADELNGRPRQTLGFRTPSEALEEVWR
ncbi:hypothetical protein ACWDYH_08745, partial [Nocardia goodfellowii]